MQGVRLNLYFKLGYLAMIALNVDIRQFSLIYYNKAYLKKVKNIVILQVHLEEDGFLFKLHRQFFHFGYLICFP